MSDEFWTLLCGALGIEPTMTMDEILEAADQLRAAFDVQGQIANVVGAEMALMIPVVEAAEAWYGEFLRLKHYRPGGPEVDLVAAMEKYLEHKKQRAMAAEVEEAGHDQ